MRATVFSEISALEVIAFYYQQSVVQYMEYLKLHFDVGYDSGSKEIYERDTKFLQMRKLVGSERKTNEFDKALRHKVSTDSCLNPLLRDDIKSEHQHKLLHRQVEPSEFEIIGLCTLRTLESEAEIESGKTCKMQSLSFIRGSSSAKDVTSINELYKNFVGLTIFIQNTV